VEAGKQDMKTRVTTVKISENMRKMKKGDPYLGAGLFYA
jgi:hypothetical protein